MRKGGFRKTSFVVALLLAVYLTFIPSNEKSKAVDTNAWASGAIVTDLGLVNGLSNSGNLECQYATLKSRYAYSTKTVGGKLVFDNLTTEGEGKTYPDACVAQNSHGLMSASGLWSKDLDVNNAMPVDSSRYSMMPSPGGTAVVFYDIAPTYGYQYSINHNIGYIGNVSTKKYGTGVSAKYEKIWKIDTSKMDSFLIYGTPENGTIARFDQIGFSSNGRYAVVLLSKRGFARLDLQTKELTPFYNVNYNNGVGVSMTISNDGRYVATAKNLSSNFMVHDLLGCQNVYKYGTWEATGVLQTSGCVSTNLFSNVQQVFPTANSISGLRFSPNGGLLDVFVRYSDSTGNPTNRARLSAIGYQSSASGYLAMGDSFSSGEGDLDGGYWYEPGTDEQGNINTFAGRNLCHLSRRSYPYLLAVELGYLTTNTSRPPENGNFHSVACSGAKMHNIMGVLGEKQDAGTSVDFAVTDNQYRYDGGYLLEEWQPGYERQVGFILGRKDKLITERNPFYPEVITISIGGNDAGFGQKLLACLLPGTCEFAVNEEARAQVAIELASEKQNLENTYKQIKQNAPDARIYVIGYPQFVQASLEPCGNNVHLNNDEATFINFATGYFNDIIKAAADSSGVTYVDVENILVNINLCSGATDSEMAVNGITAGNDMAISPVDSGILKYGLCGVRNCVGSETFHPNQIGHMRYKANILSSTVNLTLTNPEPLPASVPIPSDYFGITAKGFVNNLNNVPYSPQQYAKLQEMTIGAIGYKNPTVKINGLMPNSTVSFEVHSTPVPLGLFVVGTDGSVSANLQIPESLEPGYHEIHMFGFDTFGQSIEYYEPVLLGASEGDFDGDDVEDSVDSCPSIVNSGTDVDEDGMDDACDSQTELAQQEEEQLPEEEPQDDEPAEYIDKGTPSNETVAGDSDEAGGAVLGTSTTQSSSVLSATGKDAVGIVGFGVALSALSILITIKSRRKSYKC